MDVLYLAWRYLVYHRFKTLVLIGSITLILYLPIGLNTLVQHSAEALLSRAGATPMLMGAKGSPLELVLNSMYFESDVPPVMRYAELERLEASGLARVFPLFTGFGTRHGPIVGTSLEYFELRGLRVAAGRQMAMIGECVLGARVAESSGLVPGDSILSVSKDVFDLAGVYPLKMKIVGVLQPSGTADDVAVFVDVKTTWVIQGLAHGHEDLESRGARDQVLRREGNRIVGNASVVQFTEITPQNVASFHFHGDPADFPLTAVIVAPYDTKSSTLLEGRYLGDDELVQIVNPLDVIEELLQTILQVRGYLLFGMALLGVSTLATATLVFLLSLQLRRREMETMIKIGASPRRVALLVASEVLGVLGSGILLAIILCLVTRLFASSATQMLIRMS